MHDVAGFPHLEETETGDGWPPQGPVMAREIAAEDISSALRLWVQDLRLVRSLAQFGTVHDSVGHSPVVVWGWVCRLVALAEEFLDEGAVGVVLVDLIPVKVILQGCPLAVSHLHSLWPHPPPHCAVQ